MIKFHIVSILLLALSSNLDNVGVGISYGARKINIPFYSNLLIALITTTGTFLAMTVGNEINKFLSPNAANALGSLIIAGAGVWVFIQKAASHNDKEKSSVTQQLQKTNISSRPFFRKVLMILDHPFLADTDFSGHISIEEGFLLGLALTLNNLANGIGAGLIRLNTALVTIFTAIFSIVTIWFGIEFGQYSGVHWFGKYSTRISGVILIALGIYEYFG